MVTNGSLVPRNAAKTLGIIAISAARAHERKAAPDTSRSLLVQKGMHNNPSTLHKILAQLYRLLDKPV